MLLDVEDRPVTVSRGGDNRWNVIVWMDHRAVAQADRINQTGHDVLRYVGGVISPEMETPKLLWLQEQLPASFQRTARFLDLADFLSYRATGNDVRSLCTVVCKWTCQGLRGWDASYFERIGLGELTADGFARIGRSVRPMGERAGGLTRPAAEELGLEAGTPVAVSIINAHAGGLGLLGAPLHGALPTEETLEERVALIGGTSTCHMAVSRAPKFIRGVWGPYESAMIPGLWLTEGGQSRRAPSSTTPSPPTPAAPSSAEARREGQPPTPSSIGGSTPSPPRASRFPRSSPGACTSSPTTTATGLPRANPPAGDGNGSQAQRFDSTSWRFSTSRPFRPSPSERGTSSKP